MAAIILTHTVLCSVATSHPSSACLESTAVRDAAKNTTVCKSVWALSIFLLQIQRNGWRQTREALSDILKLAGAAFTPNDMARPTFGSSTPQSSHSRTVWLS